MEVVVEWCGATQLSEDPPTDHITVRLPPLQLHHYFYDGEEEILVDIKDVIY